MSDVPLFGTFPKAPERGTSLTLQATQLQCAIHRSEPAPTTPCLLSITFVKTSAKGFRNSRSGFGASLSEEFRQDWHERCPALRLHLSLWSAGRR